MSSRVKAPAHVFAEALKEARGSARLATRIIQQQRGYEHVSEADVHVARVTCLDAQYNVKATL